MKVFISQLLMLTILFQLSAQTKMIAYKSHSGCAANFKKAIDDNLFDMGESNYGLGPATRYTLKKLDSVVYLNDSTALVKYSEGTMNCYFTPPSKAQLLAQCQHWNSTTDTLYHANIKKKKEVKAIKEILKKNQYDNPIDSVAFIGFDGAGNHKKKASAGILGTSDRNDGPPFDKTFLWLGAGLLLTTIATGLLNKKVRYTGVI